MASQVELWSLIIQLLIAGVESFLSRHQHAETIQWRRRGGGGRVPPNICQLGAEPPPMILCKLSSIEREETILVYFCLLHAKLTHTTPTPPFLILTLRPPIIITLLPLQCYKHNCGCMSLKSTHREATHGPCSQGVGHCYSWSQKHYIRDSVLTVQYRSVCRCLQTATPLCNQKRIQSTPHVTQVTEGHVLRHLEPF